MARCATMRYNEREGMDADTRLLLGGSWIQETDAMAVTITLNEPLASRLEVQALAHQLPLEEYAMRILGNAVNGSSDPEWQACNQRRVALIRKRFAGGLGQEEADELQRLQLLADQKVEALDKARLADLRHLRDQVEQIISRPTS